MPFFYMKKYSNQNNLNKLEEKGDSAEAYNSFASGKATTNTTPAKK